MLIDPTYVEVAPVDGLLVVVGADGEELFSGTAGLVFEVEEVLFRELLQGAGDVATGEWVVVQMYLSTGAEVLELDFINVGGDNLQIVIAVDTDTEITFVTEVAGAGNIVHLYTTFAVVEHGAVHLARMGYEDYEDIVAVGKAEHRVADMQIPLQVGHARLLRTTTKGVQGVKHTDADATSLDGFASYIQHFVQSECLWVTHFWSQCFMKVYGIWFRV